MIRRLSRLLHAGSLVGLVALATSAACVDSQEYLLIERAVWYSPDSTDCIASSSDTLQSLTADVYFNSPIGLGLVLTNYRVENGGSNSNLNDTEMVLDYAEVNLSFSGGSVASASFDYQLPTTSLFGGDTTIVIIHLPAEVSTSLNASMSALPPNTLERLEVEVIVHARTTGSPGSNSKIGAVQTRPFIFPLDICYQCLTLCVTQDNCGGEGDALVCPSPDVWYGACGYAQGGSIYDPTCEPPA